MDHGDTEGLGLSSLGVVDDDGGVRPSLTGSRNGVALRGKSSQDRYDPTAFYVRARNRHDHTFKWSGNLDPDVMVVVQRLVASGALLGTPIDDVAAFIRDAMYHNVERIKGMIADPAQAAILEAAADDMRRLAQADAVTRDINAKRTIVAGARECLEEAFQARDDAMVDQLLELYDPMVDRLRAPYGDQLEEILQGARVRRNTV